MDSKAKYKVGDIVHFHLVKGDSFVSSGVVKEVLNTRVDGGWGYMYRLNESGSLCLKESDIF